MVGQRK
jgi:ribosomal protein S11